MGRQQCESYKSQPTNDFSQIREDKTFSSCAVFVSLQPQTKDCLQSYCRPTKLTFTKTDVTKHLLHRKSISYLKSYIWPWPTVSKQCHISHLFPSTTGIFVKTEIMNKCYSLVIHSPAYMTPGIFQVQDGHLNVCRTVRLQSLLLRVSFLLGIKLFLSRHFYLNWKTHLKYNLTSLCTPYFYWE